MICLHTADPPTICAIENKTNKQPGFDMEDEWKYQLRITLEPEFARVARHTPSDPGIKPLAEILSKHNATLKCQFDAFANYVAEAEKYGVDRYPLYAWTKATIENPVKEAKYIKSFTLYAGGDEVYTKEKADALMADIEPLVGGPVVASLSKHDTNPANNPQPPKQFKKQ